MNRSVPAIRARHSKSNRLHFALESVITAKLGCLETLGWVRDVGGQVRKHQKWKMNFIWVFPTIEVPQNGWFIMEHPIKMDDLGVPLFSEAPI